MLPRGTVVVAVACMSSDKSPKREAVQIRMTEEDHDIFERLVESRAAELRDEGVEVTGPGVLRWLIRKEAAARGILKGPAPSAKKGSKK